MTEQVAQVVVAPVASSTVSTSPVGVPNGHVTLAGVTIRSGTVPTRGQCYVRIIVLRGRTVANAEERAVLWAGYVRAGHIPSSIPNLRVNEGESFYAQVTATATVPGDTVLDVRVVVETDPSKGPAGGAWTFAEVPGSGDGAPRLISLGDPAAGAEYPNQLVPAVTQWRVRAFRGSLVTSAIPGDRRFSIRFTDTANFYFEASPRLTQPASQTRRYNAAMAGGEQSVSGVVYTVFPLPDMYLPTGHRVDFVSDSLDGGDNYGDGFLMVEEWAVPQ